MEGASSALAGEGHGDTQTSLQWETRLLLFSVLRFLLLFERAAISFLDFLLSIENGDKEVVYNFIRSYPEDWKAAVDVVKQNTDRGALKAFVYY